MIKILGEEFELDTMDLDVSETIEKEMKKVPEKLNKLSNNVTRIEAIRETVIIVSECMDNILGKSASERIFKGKRNLKLAMKAFEELAIGISKEDENYDDSYIYSAFLSQYNIDLQDINDLHWWKFKAMFESLKEDNKICEIMKYRASDLSKIKDKEEKAFYKKMKQIYKLPEYIDKEQKEKEDEIAKILMGDGVLDLDVLT